MIQFNFLITAMIFFILAFILSISIHFSKVDNTTRIKPTINNKVDIYKLKYSLNSVKGYNYYGMINGLILWKSLCFLFKTIASFQFKKKNHRRRHLCKFVSRRDCAQYCARFLRVSSHNLRFWPNMGADLWGCCVHTSTPLLVPVPPRSLQLKHLFRLRQCLMCVLSWKMLRDIDGYRAVAYCFSEIYARGPRMVQILSSNFETISAPEPTRNDAARVFSEFRCQCREVTPRSTTTPFRKQPRDISSRIAYYHPDTTWWRTTTTYSMRRGWSRWRHCCHPKRRV